MWLERISNRERPYCGSRLPAIARPARLPSTPPTPIVDAAVLVGPRRGALPHCGIRILPGRSTFGPSRRWRPSILGPGRVMALPPCAVRAVLGFPDSPAPRVLPPVPESTRVYGFISPAFKSRDSNHENRLCAGQFEHAGLSGAGRRPECRRLRTDLQREGVGQEHQRPPRVRQRRMKPGQRVKP
jgi:hypothetical protein